MRVIQDLYNNKTTQFKDGKRLADPCMSSHLFILYAALGDGKGAGARGIPIKKNHISLSFTDGQVMGLNDLGL